MKLVSKLRLGKYLSRLAVLGATLFAFGLAPSYAAELVMFERAGCAWCEVFDREIAPVYPKTAEGRRAPLRRINTAAPLPADLAFIEVERLTPLFVLVDQGREIGRIRGYPGEDHFWGLLGALMGKLEKAKTGREHAQTAYPPLRRVN